MSQQAGTLFANPKWWPTHYGLQGNGVTGQVGTAFQVNVTAFYLPRSVVASRLTLDITTVGGAGTKCRLGLYADNGVTPQGATLLFDSGDLAADSLGVQVASFPSPIPIPAGFVWAALETADAIVNFRRYVGTPEFFDVGSEVLQGASYNRGSYGALTNPCPAVTIGVNSNFTTRLRIDSIA